MTDTKKPDLKVLPTMEDVDPFDPKAFSLSPGDGMTAEAGKQVLMTVPVRKPGKAEFLRVHPDFTSTIALLEHDREFFLVDRSLRAVLRSEIKPAQLYTCIARSGVVFLWPIRLPAEDGKNNRWWSTAHAIAQEAKHSWVRCTSSQDLGGYEMTQAQVTLPEPTWPEGKSFRDLCELAFAKQRIDNLDHAVVKQLQGRI